MAASDTTMIDRYEAYLGIGVGKETHCAYASDSLVTVLLSRRISNTEPELNALIVRCPEDTLVIFDQRRNIGVFVLRRAKAAKKAHCLLAKSVECDIAKSFPSIVKTDGHDAQVIAWTAHGTPHTLRPVPKADPELDGVRMMSTQHLLTKL